jgi:hypothetical protein
MGWNDRLPDCDKNLPSDADRQAYFDWQEYQHYLAFLAAEIERESAPPVPARMGLSSQTIDPDSFGGLSKDIFPGRPLTPKEPARVQDQDQAQDHAHSQEE